MPFAVSPFSAGLVLAAVALGLLAAPGVRAHSDVTGYVACVAGAQAPPAGADQGFEGGYPSVGLRNTCDFPVVGVLCARDAYGNWQRYDVPVNLPVGHTHFWTDWSKGETTYGGFSCRPSATCFAGPAAHDPHCHQIPGQ